MTLSIEEINFHDTDRSTTVTDCEGNHVMSLRKVPEELRAVVITAYNHGYQQGERAGNNDARRAMRAALGI